MNRSELRTVYTLNPFLKLSIIPTVCQMKHSIHRKGCHQPMNMNAIIMILLL